MNGENEYETDGNSICLNGNGRSTGDGVTKVAPENCRYDVCLLGAVELGYEVDNQRPIIERYRKSKVDQGFCEFLIPIK